MKLKNYIKNKRLSVVEAAGRIGVSYPTLYRALRNEPLGRRCAARISAWTSGKVKTIDLMLGRAN